MQPSDRSIYERGCLRAMEDWLESHILVVATSTCSTMIVQVTDIIHLFSCRRILTCPRWSTTRAASPLAKSGWSKIWLWFPCVPFPWFSFKWVSLISLDIFSYAYQTIQWELPLIPTILFLLQILGICFAQNLRADILAQKAKWHWRTSAPVAYPVSVWG